jgi:hypothetical protein
MKRPLASLLVLSSMLAGCTVPNSRVSTRPNDLAELGGGISALSNPLLWKVVTSGVDPQSSTMYTLYGNDIAVLYARTSVGREYPDGAVLALVTWQQQDDARWFGARIPARPESVEFLNVSVPGGGHSSNAYRRYEGSPLREVASTESQNEARVATLLSLRAAVMP